MKIPSTLRLALLVAFFVIRHSPFVFAQGPLTPPLGPPGPLFKSLDQVEARTPIASAPFTISTSGSYYLTGNLSVGSGNGITISADHVTLDLNGFTISSFASPAAGTGVLLNGVLENITIKNGNVRGTTTFSGGTFTTGGFLDGIANGNSGSTNLRVSDINVHGVGDDGIDLLSRAVPTYLIERCTVSVCGGLGMHAGRVGDSAAATTGGTAIFANIAAHCSGETVDAEGPSNGVSAIIAEHCQGVAITGAGVLGITVSSCHGYSTTAVGLAAGTAHHCEGTSVAGSFGLDAGTGGIASFCRGRREGGVALRAFNAIGCSVLGSGTVTATNKSLGTP